MKIHLNQAPDYIKNYLNCGFDSVELPFPIEHHIIALENRRPNPNMYNDGKVEQVKNELKSMFDLDSYNNGVDIYFDLPDEWCTYLALKYSCPMEDQYV